MHRRSQPPTPIALKTTGLAAGIVASIDAWDNQLDMSPPLGTKAWTPLGTPTVRASPAGKTLPFTGTTLSYSRAVDVGLTRTTPWTIAVVHRPIAQLARSQLFGFGFAYNVTALDGTVTNQGQYRGILNFNSNYYFWGSNADWDTGITWDTDGATHVIVLVNDGANLTLWRDGVNRASSALPAGLVTTPAGRLVVAGSYLSGSGTTSPSSDIVSGRIWSRGLVQSEIIAYSANWWQVFPDVNTHPPYPATAAAGGSGKPTVYYAQQRAA